MSEPLEDLVLSRCRLFRTPDWKAQLTKQRVESASGDFGWLATWLGIPLARDYPLPGVAAAWTSIDWRKWCTDHGFVQSRTTKHAERYSHQLFPELHLNLPQDSNLSAARTGMNLAAQFRRTAVAWFNAFYITFDHLFSSLPEEEETAIAYLVEHRNDATALIGTGGTCDSVDGRSVYNRLVELAREWKRSIPVLVRESVDAYVSDAETADGISKHDAEEFRSNTTRLVEAAKLGLPVPRLLLDLVVEYSRLLSAQETADRELLRARRNSVKKPDVDTGTDVVKSWAVRTIKADRDVARKMVETAKTRLVSAMDALDLVMRQFQSEPVVDTKEVDTVSRDTYDAVVAQVSTLSARCDALTVRNSELEEESSRPRPGSVPLEEHRAFAKLILETVVATDFSNLASNLSAIKKLAQEHLES